MDHIVIEFKGINSLKDVIIDVVQSLLDLLSHLLLRDVLLDPLALAGALVPDLTRLHQRVQSKIAKFNSLAKVFK